MPFIIRCIKCQRKLRVLDRLAGKLVKCPACQTKFVAQTAASPAVAMARPVGPSGSRTAPKPPPSAKVPLSRPAPGAPPSSKVPTGPRSRVNQAVSPEVTTVDYSEEEFIPASAAMKPRPRPLDDIQPPSPSTVSKSGVRRPVQTPFVNVFVTLGGVLLVTAILGLATAWWVNSGVQRLQGTPAATGKR